MAPARLKLVYLTPDMAAYPAAAYQADVARELAVQHDVFFYGPGYDHYAPDDTIDDVLAKAPWRPTAIGVGHAWLRDQTGGAVAKYPQISLAGLTIPKFFILNKEYTGLAAKLAFAAEEKFDLILTHHHDAASYQAATGIRTVFWPFATDGRAFFPRPIPKDVDFFFSGILRNRSYPETQSNLRVRVQQRLFVMAGPFRLGRRARYAGQTIVWNSYSGDKWIDNIDRMRGSYRRIPGRDYHAMFNRSKACLCTLSPLDLVSPRFFEAMASGSLVFCPRSERYRGLFDDQTHCLTFREDLSDFDEQFAVAVGDDGRREEITARASAHALKHHTWQRRIEQLGEYLAQV